MSDLSSIPKTDPIWAMMIWRSDSATLARLRPFLEEIIQLSNTPCLVGGDTCLDERGLMRDKAVCLACELKMLRVRMSARVRDL